MLRFATIFVLLILGGCTTKSASTSSDNSQHSVVATVVGYESNVEWDHFDDGSFATYDKLTLQLETPANSNNKSLVISVSPTDLANDSPFRVSGTRMTFTLDDPITPDVNIAWGALKNPTVVE
jgi:hypothetical protein